MTRAVLIALLALALVPAADAGPSEKRSRTGPAALLGSGGERDRPFRHRAAGRVEGDLRTAELYPAVPLATIAGGKWVRPRAAVTGTVTVVRKEADGDTHFRLEDGTGAFIICEIIPELPMPPPKVGTRVTVRGIVRFDGEHKWNELHPVVGWTPAR